MRLLPLRFALGRNDRQGIVFGVAVAVVITILFLSPLLKGGFIAGHDTGYHLTRAQLFATALKEGQFPVRWIEGPVPGITHPLFLFYPPLFYYPVAILMLLGISYTLATYIVIAAAAVIAFAGMYFLIKDLTGNQLAALAAATLFLFTPYRISQLYVRAAYGEFLATAFLPWAFLGVKKNWVLLAVSLAAMVTSHQPTLIIVAGPLVAWAIYQKNRLAATVSGGILGAGLAAFFLLPLVTEGSLIRAGRLASGYFDFRQHFATLSQLVYSAWGYGVSVVGTGDGMSFQVGIINWGVILTVAGFLLLSLRDPAGRRGEAIPLRSPRRFAPRDDNRNGLSLFFLFLFLFSLFMATQASLPIWERFETLGFIQYPWRFLILSSFATAVLGGLVFYNLYNRYKSYKHYIFLLFLLPILFNWKYLAPSAFMPAGTFNLGNPELARYNSPQNPFFGVELGYFPIWVSEVNTDPGVKRFTATTGTAEVTPIRDTMTLQEATVRASDAATIRVNTHYFPGWVAHIDDGTSKKTVIPAYDNPQGNMEVTLGKGDYRLTFTLTKTPLRRIADYLSLASLLVVAVAAARKIAPRRFWSKYAGATSAARVKRSKA